MNATTTTTTHWTATTTTRIVLGVGGPEMAAVAALAAECGIPTVQATVGGRPVTPATALQTDAPSPEEGDVWVECRPATGRGPGGGPEWEVQGATLVAHWWDDDNWRAEVSFPVVGFLTASSMIAQLALNRPGAPGSRSKQ